MTTIGQRTRIWDLPTRLFHWLLVVLIVAAVITGKTGGNAIVWHGRIGLAIIGLIAFRVVWGLVGTTYARFSSFLPTPSSIATYLRGQWNGHGHNPLGALSVLGFLVLIAVQAGSGLFANDDIAFRGPLADLIDKALSDDLTALHRVTANGLIALIALHLGAIAFYVHVKKKDLINPMIRGWKTIEDGESVEIPPTSRVRVKALVLSVTVALTSVYAASGAWISTPPPQPPTSSAPAW